MQAVQRGSMGAGQPAAVYAGRETGNCANVKRIWFIKTRGTDTMRFGEKLSLLRKQRGMTQLELAEELNVSRQAVSRWEQGISNPSTENMVRIGELLDVSIDTLVNENAQLQTVLAVPVAGAEEKKAVERHDKRGILKIAVTVLAAVIVALIVFIGLSREQYVPAQPPGPIDMDELEKDMINQDNSNKGVLPLEPVD